MDDEIYIYTRRVLDFHREFSHNETLFVELLLPSFGKYELSFIIKTGVNRARFSKTKGGGEGGDKLCRRLNDETAVIDEREGGREREGRTAKWIIGTARGAYLQIVVHVRHVRSIAKRLDERLLRLRHASLGAQHAAQITISCNNHNGHSLEGNGQQGNGKR